MATTTLVLRDPYFYERIADGRCLDRREPCHHNCGNEKGPEGCAWCEQRTPIHVLSAGVHHALAQVGRRLRFISKDYGWFSRDNNGLRAAVYTPSGIHPPQVPTLRAPEDHPVWSELRAYCAERDFDPEFWITPEGVYPAGYGYTEDDDGLSAPVRNPEDQC